MPSRRDGRHKARSRGKSCWSIHRARNRRRRWRRHGNGRRLRRHSRRRSAKMTQGRRHHDRGSSLGERRVMATRRRVLARRRRRSAVSAQPRTRWTGEAAGLRSRARTPKANRPLRQTRCISEGAGVATRGCDRAPRRTRAVTPSQRPAAKSNREAKGAQQRSRQKQWTRLSWPLRRGCQQGPRRARASVKQGTGCHHAERENGSARGATRPEMKGLGCDARRLAVEEEVEVRRQGRASQPLSRAPPHRPRLSPSTAP